MTRLLLAVYRPILRTVLSVEGTAGLKRHGDACGGGGGKAPAIPPKDPTMENLPLSLHGEVPSIPGASVQAMTL